MHRETNLIFFCFLPPKEFFSSSIFFSLLFVAPLTGHFNNSSWFQGDCALTPCVDWHFSWNFISPMWRLWVCIEVWKSSGLYSKSLRRVLFLLFEDVFTSAISIIFTKSTTAGPPPPILSVHGCFICSVSFTMSNEIYTNIRNIFPCCRSIIRLSLATMLCYKISATDIVYKDSSHVTWL